MDISGGEEEFLKHLLESVAEFWTAKFACLSEPPVFDCKAIIVFHRPGWNHHVDGQWDFKVA
jgi:hypothetical protein